MKTRWKSSAAAAAGLALTAAMALAQMAPGGLGGPGSGIRALREYQYEQMLAEIQKDFDAGENQKAADACEKVLQQYPDDAGTRYNLACAHARLKEPNVALADLAKAVASGWDDADHMMQDDDLASIRNDKKFAALVAATRLNYRADGAIYEPGKVIPGVKTVEDFPEGGLRYRIRIPEDATPEKPAKLIIWLHPSGESMNSQIEALAPEFAAHGYALMIFSHKQFMGWTSDEADALVHKTLPALKAYKQIDSARPVLMGYGAGGQLALSLWAAHPAAWSGLLLDEAFPVQLQTREGQIKDIELPPIRDGLRKTPLFVLLGANDTAGVRRWDLVENKWLAAGVPLTVKKVPGKSHDWLLGNNPPPTQDPQKKALEEFLRASGLWHASPPANNQLKQAFNWLDALKAGKLPADTPKARELAM